MRVYSVISGLLFLLLSNCVATSAVVYDYNLEVDFNQYHTYVLCMDDFFVSHPDHPNLDNEELRQLIGDAVAIEMENKAHHTNVFDPQLQAGFTLLIHEETVQFESCEYSEELEYWESCKLQEETYEQETLVVYVSDFKTNMVLWHASIVCDLNTSKKKRQSYINSLVKDLFATYPKTQVGKNLDETKDF
jgi:hypothetical protein